MFLLGPLLTLSAIGFCCWLLFTLAVFALPAFIGITIGIWSFHTGAGALSAIIVGLVAAGATFGIGQLLLLVVPWTWARRHDGTARTAGQSITGASSATLEAPLGERDQRHQTSRPLPSSPAWQRAEL